MFFSYFQECPYEQLLTNEKWKFIPLSFDHIYKYKNCDLEWNEFSPFLDFISMEKVSKSVQFHLLATFLDCIGLPYQFLMIIRISINREYAASYEFIR